MFRKQNLRPGSKNVFDVHDLIQKHFFASEKQELRPQQCFPGGQTGKHLRPRHVSATMFPSLARPLASSNTIRGFQGKHVPDSSVKV